VRSPIRLVVVCLFLGAALILPFGVLRAADPAPAAPPATALAKVSPVQIAKSALLSIEGTPTPHTLDLRIRKLSDKSLISADDVNVTVDGRSETVTRVNVDTYQIPADSFRGTGAHEVEITVPHDGIREILGGKVILPEAGASATGLLGDHKQMAWWILNIVIVLIAAVAISNRKG
jgi:hypothetical protein